MMQPHSHASRRRGTPKAESAPAAPTKHPWFCCTAAAPCELHLSISDRTITLTSKELRDAVRARAAEENVSPKDLILKAVNVYLGRAKTAQSWATMHPLVVPGWVADRLT